LDAEMDRAHAEWQAGKKEVDDAFNATEPHSKERKEAREKRKQWEEKNGQVPPPSSSNPLSDVGALSNKDSDIKFSLAGTGWRLTGAKETSIRGKTILYVTNGKDGGWVEESDLTDQHRQILGRSDEPAPANEPETVQLPTEQPQGQVPEVVPVVPEQPPAPAQEAPPEPAPADFNEYESQQIETANREAALKALSENSKTTAIITTGDGVALQLGDRQSHPTKSTSLIATVTNDQLTPEERKEARRLNQESDLAETSEERAELREKQQSLVRRVFERVYNTPAATPTGLSPAQAATATPEQKARAAKKATKVKPPVEAGPEAKQPTALDHPAIKPHMQPKHQARVQALEAQGVQVVTVETEEDAAKVLGVPLKRKGNRGVTAIVNGKPVVIFIAKNFAGKKDGGAVITEELHHAAALVVLQQNPELLNEALAEVGGLNGGTAIYSKWDSLTPLGKLIEAAAAYASGKWNPDASSPVKRLVDAIMDAISKAFGLDSAQAKTATAKAIRSLADSADALLDSQPAPQEPAQASQKEASQPAPAAKPPEQMTPEEVVELEYRRQIKPLTPEEYEQKFPKPKDSASRLTWANDRKRYLWQLAAANINIPNEWVRDMPSQEFVLAAGYVKQGNEWVRRKTGIPPWKGVMAENSAIMEYPRVQEWLQKKRENAEIYAASSHSDQVNSAVWEGDSKPSVSAAAVDAYGIKLPEGYTREGDLYVYRPDGKAMIMTMKPGDRIMDEQGRMSAPMAKLKVVQTTKTGHEIWGIYFDRDGVIEGPYKLGDYAPELEEGGRIIRANEAAPSPAPASQPAGQAEAFKVGDFVRANGKGPVFKIESIGSDGWLYLANGQGSYSAEDAAKILVKSTEDAATKEAVKGGFPGFDSQPAQPPRPATPEGRAEAALAEYEAEVRQSLLGKPDKAARDLAGRKLDLAKRLRARLKAMTGAVDYDVYAKELREKSGELEVKPVGRKGSILFINPEKLIDRLTAKHKTTEAAREAMDVFILHEFIHKAAIGNMDGAKIIGLYNLLTPEAKAASKALYLSDSGLTDFWQDDKEFAAAHEWFAQLVEARLRGKISNQAEIEASQDPAFRDRLLALLKDFVAQLRDIAKLVTDKAQAARIEAEADAVQAIASDMAAKAGLEIQAGPEAEAKPAPTKAAPLTKTEQREVDRIAGNLKSTGRNPSVLNELKTRLSIQKGYEQQAIETAKHYENPNNAVYNLDTAKRQRKAAEVYKAEAARLSALIAKLEPSQAQPAPQAEPAQASQAPVAAKAAIPSLGDTGKAIWQGWKGMVGINVMPGESIVGVDVHNGGQYFWSGDELMRSTTNAKQGYALSRPATKAEIEGLHDSIDRGGLQIESRVNTGATGMFPKGDGGKTTRVFHQATGKPLAEFLETPAGKKWTERDAETQAIIDKLHASQPEARPAPPVTAEPSPAPAKPRPMNMAGQVRPEKKKAEKFTLPPQEPFKPSAERFAQFYRDYGIPEDVAMKNGANLMESIETGEWTNLLHPDNKRSRAIWEAWTRQKLPAGVKASEEAFAKFIINYHATSNPVSDLTDEELGRELLRIGPLALKPYASEATKARALALAKENAARQPSPAAQAPAEAPEAGQAAQAPAEGGQGAKPAKAEAGIADFGEKILGARKDLWGKYKRIIEQDLPDSMEDVTLAKNVPEPDYEAAIANGVPVEALAVLKAIRDVIPPKPKKSYKLKNWGEAVKFLHKLTQDTLASKSLDPALLTALEKTSRISGLAGKIELYQRLGYPLFTKAKPWTIGNWDVRYFKGQKLDNFTPATVASKDDRSTDMLVLSTGKDAFNEVADMIKAQLQKETESPAPDKPKTKEIPFNIYRDRFTNDHFIGRKGINGVVRLKAGFADVKAARQYLADNKQALEEQWEGMKIKPDYRRTVNQPRQGPERRDGDVTPEMFQSTFGFRGVQFGNWVEGDRRQTDLNQAFDALIDLAEILGVPPKAMSLDGSLGLAFGARGTAGAKAHYEPGEVVINLTKETGPGSLAHEWFHAFDNYFARLDTTGETKARSLDKFATSNKKPAQDKMRPAVWEAFKRIRTVLDKGTFAARSKSLDDARSKPYYSTLVEKAARAFEQYTVDRLAGKEIANDYLVNLVKDESPALPTQAEMDNDGIRAAYDNLFNVLDAVDTDTGVRLQLPPADKGQPAGLGLPPKTGSTLIATLPRDMREQLFNEYATYINPEANQRQFQLKRVPSGEIEIEGMQIDSIPEAQLQPMTLTSKVPPIVIADGKLTDGQHRIAAARKAGRKTLPYIDITGLTDTEKAGFISTLPAQPALALPPGQPAVTAGQDGPALRNPPAPEGGPAASVPTQITRDMRQQLYDRGYTKEQVNKMKPAEAHAILNPPAEAEQEAEAEEAGQTDADMEAFIAEQQAIAEEEEAARQALLNDPANIEGMAKAGKMDVRNKSLIFQNPAARRFYQAVQAATTQLGMGYKQNNEELRAWARKQFDSDPEGSYEWALESADDISPLREEEQALLIEVMERAFEENSQFLDRPGIKTEKTTLAKYVDETRSRSGRNLQFGVDQVETPQQRWNRALEHITGPDLKQTHAWRFAPSASAKAKQIADLEARLATAQDREKRDIEAALKAAENTKTRQDILDEVSQENNKILDGILKNMGNVSRDDISHTPLERHAMQMAILDLKAVKDGLDQYRGKDNDGYNIMRLAFRGFSDEHIANALNLNQDDVGQFIHDATNAIIRPAVAEQVKAGTGFGGLIKAGFARLKKAVGLGLPPKAIEDQPSLIKGTRQSVGDVTAEVNRVMAYALQSAKARNSGKLMSKVVMTPGGQKVRVFVPFDPDDMANYYAFAREYTAAKASAFDKVYEYWINWPLLSGPQTQVANITGNAAQVAWHYTGQRLAEATLNLAYQDPNAPQFREFKHILKGFWQGIGPAYEMARQTFLTEGDTIRHKYLGEPMQIDVVDGDLDKVGNIRASVGGQTGRISRLPGRVLRFTDAFFKTAIMYAEASAVAYRRAHVEAKRQGLKGQARAAFIDTEIANTLNDTSSAVWGDVMKTAEDLLFQGNNSATEFVDTVLGGYKGIKDLEKLLAEAEAKGDSDAAAELNKRIRARKFIGSLMRWIFPFQRTPTNIVRAGIKKAGGSAISLLYGLTMAGWRKAKDGTDFVKSYPKAMQIKDASETLLAGLGWLALASMLEGDDNDDEKPVLLVGTRSHSLKERAATDQFLRKYGGENSIVWQDGKGKVLGSLPFGRYEPIGTTVSTWIDAYRNYQDVKRLRSQGENASYSTYMMSSFASSLEDKSFLQGLANMMQFWRDVEERRENPDQNAWTKFLFTNVMPNLIKQTARQIDDVIRDRTTAGPGYAALPNPDMAPKLPVFAAQPKISTTGERLPKAFTPPARLLFQANTKVTPQPDALLYRANRLHPTKRWSPQPLNRDDYTADPPGKAKPVPITDPAKKRQFAELAGRLYATKAAQVAAKAMPSERQAPGESLIKAFRQAREDAMAAARKQAHAMGLHKATATP